MVLSTQFRQKFNTVYLPVVREGLSAGVPASAGVTHVGRCGRHGGIVRQMEGSGPLSLCREKNIFYYLPYIEIRLLFPWLLTLFNRYLRYLNSVKLVVLCVKKHHFFLKRQNRYKIL